MTVEVISATLCQIRPKLGLLSTLGRTPLVRLLVDFFQTFDFLLFCCGFVVGLQLTICCRCVVDFVAQLLVRKIHN